MIAAIAAGGTFAEDAWMRLAGIALIAVGAALVALRAVDVRAMVGANFVWLVAWALSPYAALLLIQLVWPGLRATYAAVAVVLLEAAMVGLYHWSGDSDAEFLSFIFLPFWQFGVCILPILLLAGPDPRARVPLFGRSAWKWGLAATVASLIIQITPVSVVPRGDDEVIGSVTAIVLVAGLLLLIYGTGWRPAQVAAMTLCVVAIFLCGVIVFTLTDELLSARRRARDAPVSFAEYRNEMEKIRPRIDGIEDPAERERTYRKMRTLIDEHEREAQEDVARAKTEAALRARQVSLAVAALLFFALLLLGFVRVGRRPVGDPLLIEGEGRP